jgi:MFS family permease
VVILSAHAALRPYASGSWILVGILASFSMLIWSWFASRFGRAPALVCALVLLGAGCTGPVLAQNAVGALSGAFGLGATFMAVSMLTVGIVRDLEPQRSSTRIAQATAIFSVGQVLGPLFSAYTYQHTGSYNEALLVACAALLLAAAIVAFDSARHRFASKTG